MHRAFQRIALAAWRWNRRNMGEGERVSALLKAAPKSRLTYKRLTRKVDA